MKGVALLNGAAFAIALGTSMGAVGLMQRGDTSGPEATPVSPPLAPLTDHAGTPIPRRDYRRIVSGSTVADATLLEICEPDRIVALTEYGATNSVQSYRYAGKPTIAHLDDLERILALHADLVFVNEVGDPRPVARLREAGLVVYDLGPMRGMATLVPNIREMAEVLGHPSRGESFARAVIDQMAAVAADVPPAERHSGMYLSAYGGSLFGGGTGTNYHDVITAAGLVDAAGGFRDWPQYTSEQILTLDPDVIVTNAGMRSRICQHSGFNGLRACKSGDGVVEVDEALMEDPGPAMIDAARAVHAATRGRPTTELAGRPL